MNDDELRSRLARLDPQATAPVDPITSPRAQDLLERTMTSDLTTDLSTDAAESSSRRPSRRGLVLVSAAAAVALGVTGAVVLSQGDSPATLSPAGKKTTLALNLPGGGGGPSIGSCIPFSVDFLKDMKVAFAGTVSSVTNDAVTLDVTTWYAGGSAQVVTLANPDNTTSAALDGVTFVDGKDYLVTAAEGNVNTCGYSGEATPELQKSFEAAFPK